MKNNIWKITVCALILAVCMVSCKPEEAGQIPGITVIKIFPNDFSITATEVSTSPQTLLLFDVRKEVPDQAALNTSTTVTINFDADSVLISALNADNVAAFIADTTADPEDGDMVTAADFDPADSLYVLKSSLYTTTPAIVDGKITVTFAPGEVNKAVTITVPNSTLLGFTTKWVLGFQAKSVDKGIISQANKDYLITQVMAKNAYDGLYLTHGWVLRAPFGMPYTGLFSNVKFEMATVGANSVQMWNRVQCWASPSEGGNVGGVGYWILTVDPTTLKIGIVDPVNAAVKINPGYDSRYDPLIKTLFFKCYWGTGIGNREACDTMVYSSVRP